MDTGRIRQTFIRIGSLLVMHVRLGPFFYLTFSPQSLFISNENRKGFVVLVIYFSPFGRNSFFNEVSIVYNVRGRLMRMDCVVVLWTNDQDNRTQSFRFKALTIHSHKSIPYAFQLVGQILGLCLCVCMCLCVLFLAQIVIVTTKNSTFDMHCTH